jgi:hypothetical protein
MRVVWCVLAAWLLASASPIAAAPPALFVQGAPEQPVLEDGALEALVSSLAKERKLVLMPSSPPALSALGASLDLGSTLRQGLAEFDEVDLEAAEASLNQVVSALRDDPSLFFATSVDLTAAHAGVLRLMHLRVLSNDAAAAQELAQWWWLLHPTWPAPGPEHPSRVRELAAAARESAQRALVRAEQVGPGKCVVRANGGQPKPIAELALPPGLHALQSACGAAVGWLRRVQIPAGGAEPFRVAALAETRIARTQSGARWLPKVSSEERALRITELALALGAPIAAAIGRSPKEPPAVDVWVAEPSRPLRLLVSLPAPTGGQSAPPPVDVGRQVEVTPTSDELSTPLLPWGYGLVAAGAAVLATSMGLHLYREDLVADRAITPAEYDTASALRPAVITGYALGGAAAITGIVLWVVGAQDSPAPADSSVVPTPDGAALRIRF